MEAISLVDYSSSINKFLLFKELALVLSTFCILALPAIFPGFPFDSHLVLMGGDQVNFMWSLSFVAHSITHFQNPFFTNLLNYPVGVNLAQNTNVPLLGLLASPVTIVLGPVASFTTLMWLSYPTAATSMYYLLRRINVNSIPSFLGGLIFGFSPYMIASGSAELNLTFTMFVPLILLSFYEVVINETERKKWAWCSAFFLCCQYYVSTEVFAATVAVLALTATIYVFFFWSDVSREIMTTYRLLLIPFAALFLAILIPSWYALFGPDHYSGLPWGEFQNVYRADLLNFIMPTNAQLLYPHSLKQISTGYNYGGIFGNGTYVGIPLLLLAMFFLVRMWRNKLIRLVGLVALVTLLLSLGTTLSVGGKETHLFIPSWLYLFVVFGVIYLFILYFIKLSLEKSLLVGILVLQTYLFVSFNSVSNNHKIHLDLFGRYVYTTSTGYPKCLWLITPGLIILLVLIFRSSKNYCTKCLFLLSVFLPLFVFFNRTSTLLGFVRFPFKHLAALHTDKIYMPFYLLSKIPVAQNLIAGRLVMFLFLFLAIIIARGFDTFGINNQKWKNTLPVFAGSIALLSIVPTWPLRSIEDLSQNAQLHNVQGNGLHLSGNVIVSPLPSSCHDYFNLVQANSGMAFTLVGGGGRLYKSTENRGTPAPYHSPLPLFLNDFFGGNGNCSNKISSKTKVEVLNFNFSKFFSALKINYVVVQKNSANSVFVRKILKRSLMKKPEYIKGFYIWKISK